MANEITLQVKAKLNNASLKHTFDPGIKQITQTGIGLHAPVVSVGTSEEDFDPGDIAGADLGVICLLNLDTTNYVTWGAKDTTMKAIGRLMPGEPAFLRLEPSITIRWIADTAACLVQVSLMKN